MVSSINQLIQMPLLDRRPPQKSLSLLSGAAEVQRLPFPLRRKGVSHPQQSGRSNGQIIAIRVSVGIVQTGAQTQSQQIRRRESDDIQQPLKLGISQAKIRYISE